jgi:3-phenylpropionate/cinnamic acid dioxygenase small subunit
VNGTATDRRTAVEAFLIHEARLMDDHAYEAWLALWTEDALYWIPGVGGGDPATTVTIAYERMPQLTERIWRLNGKHAHAQRPRSALQRVVSNVEILAHQGDEIVARSAFVLGEFRNGVQTVFFGRNEHILVGSGDTLRMKQKKVDLLNADGAQGNLAFLL